MRYESDGVSHRECPLASCQITLPKRDVSIWYADVSKSLDVINPSLAY